MVTPQKYWVYRWLDEFDVKATDQVKKRLSDPRSYGRLVELVNAEVDDYEDELEPIEVSNGILGGRKIAAIAASLSFANKQIDKRSTLEISDYYFLWQASRVVSSQSTH